MTAPTFELTNESQLAARQLQRYLYNFAAVPVDQLPLWFEGFESKATAFENTVPAELVDEAQEEAEYPESYVEEILDEGESQESLGFYVYASLFYAQRLRFEFDITPRTVAVVIDIEEVHSWLYHYVSHMNQFMDKATGETLTDWWDSSLTG